ncbi:MAG: ATP-dependent DNA ligase [Thermomonas sp.]
MRRFTALYQRLDRLTATNDKRRALVEYIQGCPPEDLAWALLLLSGGKIGGARRKLASTGELREWVGEVSGTPAWLVEESYHHVGDLAETLTLLLPPPTSRAPEQGLHTWITQVLWPVANTAPEIRRAVIVGAWDGLDDAARLVFNKLLTGAMRIGVSQGLLQQALAEVSGLEVAVIAQRMLGTWDPTADFAIRLLSKETQAGDASTPYPFQLASPLEVTASSLGDVTEWHLEWKWDGIRLQLIHRQQEIALWSRGEERLDGRFPEIEAMASLLPECVLDGELLAWDAGTNQPRPFAALQTRIQRKKPGPKVLAATPVVMVAYDLLELDGIDSREQPLHARRTRLKALVETVDHPALRLSPHVQADGWDAAAELRTQSRERSVEGLMVKRADSPYVGGRKRGEWWKWKIDPMTIDAVLVYAQAGHGRRSNLYTDYTFALWDGDSLVPVAKAYSGLTDVEILKLDKWIRAHTKERFGPVRSVAAELVFELGFEAVNISKRHKSGIATRFPRILRWRTDKSANDADALATLASLAS